MNRITPIEPPYSPEVDAQLGRLMPDGVPPIALFRTFVHNLPLTAAMEPWGGYELSSALSLSMRERELLIDRTCALCSCEYEWGVHIAFFAERVGLTHAQITSLTHGDPSDACWEHEPDALLLQAADQLHRSSSIDDTTWTALARHYDSAQMLDIMFLCGWYHAISYAANASGTPQEEGAPRFRDYR